VTQGLLTTAVGSFGKPPYLQQARREHAAGRLATAQLDELTRRATRQVVELQERLGIDILVHGEMERGDMVAYFADLLPGMYTGGLVRSYGNRYYHKPVIYDELAWQEPVTVDFWRYAQSLTSRPVKGMLTGPYTLVEWSFDEYYADRATAVRAMAEVVRQEALALELAGARYIQIDEPACSTRPSDLPLVCEAMDIVTRGLTAKTITHICYGDFLAAYDYLIRMPVDQIDIELANRDYDLLELIERRPFPQEIGLGVIDVHTHKVESADEIVAGVERALAFLPAERIYVDPDCGLKTRTWEECEAKLRVMVEAVQRVKTKHGIE
jgi:5-methyltetrahydropteroyltriglutamate--homocysteine methyltransferase